MKSYTNVMAVGQLYISISGRYDASYCVCEMAVEAATSGYLPSIIILLLPYLRVRDGGGGGDVPSAGVVEPRARAREPLEDR